MKMTWSVRKGSVFPILGIVFALIALAFSILSVRLDGAFTAGLPSLPPASQSGVASLLGILLPAASAVLLLAVCTGYCFGLSRKPLILTAVLLLACGLCRYGVDLYQTLYVQRVNFYLFSPAHLELFPALLLLVCVILTVCGVLRTALPAVLLSFLSGLSVAVLSLSRVGCYGTHAGIDISGTLFFACFCFAIGLCALALERVPLQETAAPLRTPVPAEGTQPPQPGAEPSAPPTETAPLPQTAAPAPAQSAAAPFQPVLPAPMQGYAWQQISADPDGTKIFAQRQLLYDPKTGRYACGTFVPVYYPHAPAPRPQPPVSAPQPPAAVPQSTQVPPMQSPQVPPTQSAPQPPLRTAQQTDALLSQLDALHAQGILSDEEYAEKYRRVTGRA